MREPNDRADWFGLSQFFDALAKRGLLDTSGWGRNFLVEAGTEVFETDPALC